ncbi:NAT16 [Branchiostoma lanceolatum]|nr:NAT16 [Branchiostoma lanceolatum]
MQTTLHGVVDRQHPAVVRNMKRYSFSSMDECTFDVMYFQGDVSTLQNHLTAKNSSPQLTLVSHPALTPYQPPDIRRLLPPAFSTAVLSEGFVFVDWDPHKLSESNMNKFVDSSCYILVDSTEPAAKSLSFGGSYMTPRGRSQYRWSDGSMLATGDFSDWADGQPDTIYREKCVEIRPDFNYQWNNYECHRQQNFVCEKECPDLLAYVPFNRSCYLFSNSSRNYEGAEESCFQYDGRLIRVMDNETHQFILKHIMAYIDQTVSFWIGFKENGFNCADHQSGFRPLDNTTLQLARMIEEWTEAMDSGEIVGCVFLDLRKAFDKVWHAGLLSKLRAYGISGSMHNWFSSYLSERRQRVVIQGVASDWKSPLAGVPQGSVLGPTLFILYINDLASSCIQSQPNLFADDTSLSSSHHSIQHVVASLNRDLSSVSTWLSQWKLEANIDKCKAMFITTRAIPRPIPPVTLGGTILQVVTSHKHLGVTLTNTLSWSNHIDIISTKARRSSGLLCALRKNIPKDLLLRLYMTIVRPNLEYADIVWSGLTKRDQRTVESVQYQTTRIISGHFGLPYPSYESLYTELSLPSLQYRRKSHTTVTLYRLLNGRCPPHLQSLLPQTRDTNSRYPLRNSEHLTTPTKIYLWEQLRNKINREDKKASKRHYCVRVEKLKRDNPGKWYQEIKTKLNLQQQDLSIHIPGNETADSSFIANLIN